MNSLIISECYKDVKKKSQDPNEKNFTAACKLCPKRVISGNITNSSNFLKHVQEQHPREFNAFEIKKMQVGSRKRKTDVPIEAPDSQGKKGKTQTVLKLKLDSTFSNVSQSDFDSALSSMITTDMLPLAAVERKGFVNFCEKVAPQCVLMSRRTLIGASHIAAIHREEREADLRIGKCSVGLCNSGCVEQS